jgi:hypothetical protein
MSKAFVLYLNDNLIGIFDNDNAINNFIEGGIQNNFFNKENTRIDTFIMNSCYNINQKEKKPVIIIDKEKQEREEELEKKKKEYYKSEEYLKIAQDKIDLVSQINKIKYDKKLMIEKNKLYNEDLRLFELFTKEKIKDINFVIPPLFALKYPIFEKLTLENTLSFDNFLEEYEKVKPENNYDMFTSNSYEQKFKSNKSFEMEFELQI